MENLILNITQDCINRSVCGDHEMCAVAMRLKGEGFDYASVPGDSVEAVLDGESYEFDVSQECQDWIIDFDRNDTNLKPVKMVLDYHTETLRMPYSTDFGEPNCGFLYRRIQDDVEQFVPVVAILEYRAPMVRFVFQATDGSFRTIETQNYRHLLPVEPMADLLGEIIAKAYRASVEGARIK